MSRMNELIEAGLFGRGLIRISGETLVSRYNLCLVDMGLEPTELESFQIDRMGWSPEIAKEKKNDYYLSHGDANPLAIVLTPEQAHAPIYFPIHSFDWKMMDRWFESNRSQIADLTRDTAIWLDIDQEVDIYARPADLLMVKEVMVRVSTPDNLIGRAMEQDGLVRRWLSAPDSHLDVDLIGKLERSAKDDGDLRRRQLILRDIPFTDVADFYSRVFGGTFVLRSRNHEPLIFVRNQKWVSEGENVFMADETALQTLSEHGYLETDIGWWQQHLFRLEVIAESFLVDILDEKQPKLDYAALNQVKRRQLINQYRKQLGPYLELVEAASKLKEGKLPEVSEKTRLHLMHPNDELSPISREVVWQLMTYIQGGRFVPLMYRHQKTAFVRAYTRDWNEPKQTWALGRVQQFYDLASKSSGLEL